MAGAASWPPRYKLWHAVPARRPRHRGVRRLRGVRRRSRHRARRHRHRGQHVGVRRRRRQAPRRWRRRRRQQHRGLGRERARLAQDLLLELLELGRRDAAAVAEGAGRSGRLDDVGRLARRLVGLERPLLLRARTDPLSRRRREENFEFRRGYAIGAVRRRSSSRRRGTCPRRSGTCASCTSCPASSPAAAASTGAPRPASVVSSESRAMGRRPADRVRVLAAAVRIKGALRGGVAQGFVLYSGATSAPAAAFRTRRARRSSGPGRRGTYRRRCRCASCTCVRRLTLGFVDATDAGPSLPLLLEGLRLASPDPRVGLGEREGREVRRQGRDQVLLVGRGRGCLRRSRVGGAAVSSPDGSSCFDSYAGSGCSGVSAGADPSVLAAGSFHIRGSRTANLPSSALDPHSSLCTVRNAALFA